MTTILHSIDTGGPGGAETVFMALASANWPYRNIALAKPGGWVERELSDRGVESYYANPRGSFNYAYLNSIIQLIRKQNVNLIQSHLFGSNLYCSVAGLLCRIPVISAFHGAHDLLGSGISKGTKRWLVQQGSAALVSVSKTLRRELLEAGFRNTNKLDVIYNGIDINRFSSAASRTLRGKLGIPDSAPLIGAVGNIRRPKGYEVLIRAMAMLSGQNPDLHLVIAGEGNAAQLQSLQSQIQKSKLESHVHLLGYVQDTSKLFPELDAYVSSSHSEGFSLSCVEAMAAGTPVIATRSGGPEEIIDDGLTGLLVPAADHSALASAIHNTLVDTDATESRVQSAKRTVNRRFSIAAMIANYASLYGAVLESRGSS